MTDVEGLSHLESCMYFSGQYVCICMCVFWGKTLEIKEEGLQNVSLHTLKHCRCCSKYFGKPFLMWPSANVPKIIYKLPIAGDSKLQPISQIQPTACFFNYKYSFIGTVTFIHLYTVYGCFRATTAELSSYSRYHMAHKA